MIGKNQNYFILEKKLKTVTWKVILYISNKYNYNRYLYKKNRCNLWSNI